jgi:TRAP-type C4-dicarboxylate transport system substrate-binding protein
MAASAKQASLAKLWCDEVEKRTNGKVTVTFYPGGTLSSALKTYDDVVKGLADVGFSAFGLTPNRFPLTQFIELPLGYKNSYVATKLINEYYKKFFPKELEDVKVLYLHVASPNLLCTSRLVKSLEDIRGMKIRFFGPSLKIISALGGFPSAVPYPEVSNSLHKGDIEGVFMTWEGILSSNLAGTIRYVTDNYESAYGLSYFVVMNKNKWNSLPRDIQDTIEKINEQWIEMTGMAWDDMNQQGQAAGLSKGVKFISLSNEEKNKWKDRMRPIFDQYAKDTNTKNPPGERVLRFAVEYLLANQR